MEAAEPAIQTSTRITIRGGGCGGSKPEAASVPVQGLPPQAQQSQPEKEEARVGEGAASIAGEGEAGRAPPTEAAASDGAIGGFFTRLLGLAPPDAAHAPQKGAQHEWTTAA